MSASASPVSLEDFAPKVTSTCGACLLPDEVREQLETSRLRDPKRFTFPVICKWLKVAQGIDLHPDVLRRHFNRHVGDPNIPFSVRED